MNANFMWIYVFSSVSASTASREHPCCDSSCESIALTLQYIARCISVTKDPWAVENLFGSQTSGNSASKGTVEQSESGVHCGVLSIQSVAGPVSWETSGHPTGVNEPRHDAYTDTRSACVMASCENKVRVLVGGLNTLFGGGTTLRSIQSGPRYEIRPV